MAPMAPVNRSADFSALHHCAPAGRASFDFETHDAAGFALQIGGVQQAVGRLQIDVDPVDVAGALAIGDAGIETERLRLGDARLRPFGFAVKTQAKSPSHRSDPAFPAHRRSRRLSAWRTLLGRGPRGGQRQIHPDARPDLAIGDALARIVAAATQACDAACAASETSRNGPTLMQRFTLVRSPELPASLGLSAPASGRRPRYRGLAATRCAPPGFRTPISTSRAPLRRRSLRATWRCRAPTENSTTLASTKTHHDAFQDRQASALASSANWLRRTRIVACRPPFRATTHRPRPRRGRSQGSPLSPTITCAGRPRKASSAIHASRNAANPWRSNCTSILKSSSKMAPAIKLRDGGARRRRPQPPPRTPRSLRFAARQRGQRHVDAHADDHMGRSAGLGARFDQHAADLAVAEPYVVRPLERNPLGARARQRSRYRDAHAQAQGRQCAARIAEGPAQRHRRCRRRKARSSAGRAARGRHAAIRSCRPRRCPAAAGGGRAVGYWSNRLRTATPADAGAASAARRALRRCGPHPAIPPASASR